ncbi:MAG: ABC transporter ATP-binding protein [Anaerolineales bacterium]|nr:ABC transporter ATP-binding protein [Anaerolineales bacterium]
MDQAALLVENLTFRYRDRETPSLQDITLQVAEGELLLLAGASGSGKTTLIRCINGLIPRSYKGELQGRVLLGGQETSVMSLARISQIVGTVLQDPERQILGTRVRNEVAFGLENLGMSRPEIRERIDQALEYLGISRLRDRETFSLSGGEKQKVALAGILAMRPGVLLLDEPLASLDPASAQETLALARRLVDEGMALVMVEHRVEDVLSIRPDRAMFLEDGRVRYLGEMDGLFKAVNYHEIKIPAPMIIERAAAEPPPPEIEFAPAGSAGQNGEPLVRFEKVNFEYEGGVQVLHGIDLEIRRGDVIAVLGPNGAGKTTLVKHAIGLLKPRSGRVQIDGRDTHKLSVAQIANSLGYVFQSPSHMLFAPTVHEELAFGPKNLGHSPEQIEEEVKEAIQIVNLSGREKDPPLALSFGQQKRVTIAAILAMRSRILVMDEPTAGQDYQNYMDFMDAILRLPGFEAIIFITHDVDLAVIYANRVLLVNGGRLVADGPPPQALGDFERLRANRLVPTSLLKSNLDLLPKTGRFLRAEALAHVASKN